MTEVGGSGEALHRGYAPEELAAVVDSEAWQRVGPNFPGDGDLRPQDLSAQHIDRVVGAILQDPTIWQPTVGGRQEQTAWQHATPHIELPDLGDLTKIGSGESRICYRFTGADGRHMAVLYGAFTAPSVGLHVPTDPHLALVTESLRQRLYDYSDLRTYLCLPLDRYNGVYLMEYGGEEASRSIRPWSLPFARRRARERMEAHVQGMPLIKTDATEQELGHNKHYLAKPGQPQTALLIDIPIVARSH